MSTRLRPLTAVLAILTLTALSGCAGTGRPAVPVPTKTSATAPSAEADPLPEAPTSDVPVEDLPEERVEELTETPLPEPEKGRVSEQDVLRELFLSDQPAGTGPDIALRYVRALQEGQDLAAARELYVAGRMLLAQRDLLFLERVMRDVARNARLTDAVPCTTASAASQDAAVVRCGQLAVVVHVLSDEYGSGVQISDAHPSRDIVAGPHTHAFTGIEL